MGKQDGKQSICTNEKLAGLRWFEEVCFIRLLVTPTTTGGWTAGRRCWRRGCSPCAGSGRQRGGKRRGGAGSSGAVVAVHVAGREYLQLHGWKSTKS